MSDFERVTAARELLTRLDGATVGRHNAEFEPLLELVQRHPQAAEKCGAGVTGFSVRRSPLNNALALFIRRADGSEVDVSWLKCAKSTDDSPGLKLRKAMRRAVLDQTLRVKHQAEEWRSPCPLCGVPLVQGNIHVDHIVPFETLVVDFLATEGPPPTRFGEDAYSHTAVFRDADRAFMERWQDFHDTRAQLRALCATCNLTRR